jgi:hypothetical protein
MATSEEVKLITTALRSAVIGPLGTGPARLRPILGGGGCREPTSNAIAKTVLVPR